MKKKIIFCLISLAATMQLNTEALAYTKIDSTNTNLVNFNPNAISRQLNPYVDTTNLVYLTVSYGANGAVTVTPANCPSPYVLIGAEYGTDVVYLGTPACQVWANRCDGACNRAIGGPAGGYCSAAPFNNCVMQACIKVAYTYTQTVAAGLQVLELNQTVQTFQSGTTGGSGFYGPSYTPIIAPPHQPSRLICGKVGAQWANTP